MSSRFDRRDFLILTGSGVVGLGSLSQGGLPPEAQETSPDNPTVLALFSYNGGLYYYDPAGLYIEVGQTVRWAGVGRRGVTAFHPSFDNHELRIPETATPFDSRTMGSSSGSFEWTFDVEGTYDYYSHTHEYLGMVGRIVVAQPGGPGEQPPGYGNRQGRAVMYRDPKLLLEYLKSDEIVRKKRVQAPLDLLRRNFPWR